MVVLKELQRRTDLSLDMGSADPYLFARSIRGVYDTLVTQGFDGFYYASQSDTSHQSANTGSPSGVTSHVLAWNRTSQLESSRFLADMSDCRGGPFHYSACSRSPQRVDSAPFVVDSTPSSNFSQVLVSTSKRPSRACNLLVVLPSEVVDSSNLSSPSFAVIYESESLLGVSPQLVVHLTSPQVVLFTSPSFAVVYESESLLGVSSQLVVYLTSPPVVLVAQSTAS